MDTLLLVGPIVAFGFPDALPFGDFVAGGDDVTAVGVGALATGVAAAAGEGVDAEAALEDCWGFL